MGAFPIYSDNSRLLRRAKCIFLDPVRYETISPALFVHNRENLLKFLEPNSIVIVHSNDLYPTNADGNLPFKQQSDLFYLTGVDQEETTLLLLPGAREPKEREILFVRETSELIAIWEGEKLSKEEAARRTGIQRVEWSHTFESFLHRLVPQADTIYLVSNEHLRANVVVETRNARFIRACKDRYPLHRYARLAPLMQRLRITKQAEEIRLIQQACNITEAGFRRVLKSIRPGIGEWEIEADLIHEYICRGSRGHAYPPIIGSGKNACVLHYVENSSRCQDGEMVLMDAAAECVGWNSDLTRTVPVNGRFSPRQRQVYDAVLRVMHETNQLLRPGTYPLDHQKQVVEVMERELVGIGLIDAKEAAAQGPDKPLVRKYFMHGVSHHLGLDVHDVCPPNEPFAEGMVFTIEPGIYIREENLGVRLENNFLIGKDSNVDLMAKIPIEAEEIETLMNAR